MTATERAPVRGRASYLFLGEIVVFAVAFLARVGLVLTSPGGFGGNYGYDASVYYSAAESLTFGRLPYRDFVMLHPPGAMLALTPFATLGRITSDQAGFLAGNLAFTALGAINAVLVVRVALRMNLDRRAALAGGLFYAIWFGSVGAEFLSRLEPLGNFAALCGLLAYYRARQTPSRLAPVLCGAAFGAAASIKIWWAVPLLVVLVWPASRDRRAQLPRVAIGAALSMIVINGPFFLAAPSQMWHMVVIDQLGRNGNQGSPVIRIGALSGVHELDPHLSAAATGVLSVLLIGLFAFALYLAWRIEAARLVVVLAVIQGAVLMLAPSWFSFYADYLAPAAALGVAAAVSTSSAVSSRLRLLSWAPLAVAAAVTSYFLAVGPNTEVVRFPSARLAEGVEHTRCVMSDSPMGLILLDSLTRDLRDRCRNWVDVTGLTYGVDASSRPDGGPGPRAENPRWQHDLLGYLRSGQAVLLIRPGGTGVSARTLAALRRYGALTSAGGYVVYRTSPR